MSTGNDLKNLDRALADAIAASPQAADAVRKIRRQGYAVYLAIDRQEGDNRAQIELTSGKKAAAKQRFLLNKGDVSFLESVGIDATRPGPRRRAP